MVKDFLQSSLYKSNDILSSSPKKSNKENDQGLQFAKSTTPEAKGIGIQAKSFYSNSRPSTSSFPFSRSPKTYSRNTVNKRQVLFQFPEFRNRKCSPRKILDNISDTQQNLFQLAKTESKSPASSHRIVWQPPPPISLKSYEIGFPNQGHTCYLNAVLQGLLGISNFVTDLLILNERIEKLKTDKIWDKKVPLLRAFCQLAQLREAGLQDDIPQALDSLKEALVSQNRQFEGSHMQDAHEFLISLCDIFQTETAEFQKHDKDIEDIIDKNFGYSVMETRTCQNCYHETTRTSNDFVLKLMPPAKVEGLNVEHANRIEVMLKRTLNGIHEIQCEKCKVKGELSVHSITERFEELPNYLILYLPRTRYYTVGESPRYEKIREVVRVPEYLSLRKFSNEHAKIDEPMVPSQAKNSPNQLKRAATCESSSTEGSPMKKIRFSASEFSITPPKCSLSDAGSKTPLCNESDKPLPENLNAEIEPQNRLSETEMIGESPIINQKNRVKGGTVPDASICQKVFGLSMSSTSISEDETDSSKQSYLNPQSEKDISFYQNACSPNQACSFEPKILAVGGLRAIDGHGPTDTASEHGFGPNNEDDLEFSFKAIVEESEFASLQDSLNLPKNLFNIPDFAVPSYENWIENEDLKLPSPPSSPPKTSFQVPVSLTSTPIKFKNLTEAELENLSEEDKLELAMRQSVKESRKIEMAPVGMSEEEQIAQALQNSLHDTFPDRLSNMDTDEELPDISPRKEIEKLCDNTLAFENGSYRLTGVVNHLGTRCSVEIGHYVADVYSHKNKTWYRYNDERVSRRTLDEVIRDSAKDAYLFMYKKNQ